MKKKEKKKTSFFKDFKAFISKGNIMDLAIGVVIGAAFGKITTSLVADIINPLISLVIGKGVFTSLVFTLKEAVLDAEGAVVAEAIQLNLGNFLNSILDFLILAFCIFFVIRSMMKAKEASEALKTKLLKEEEEPEQAPAPAEPPAPTNEELSLQALNEIKNLLKELNDKK